MVDVECSEPVHVYLHRVIDGHRPLAGWTYLFRPDHVDQDAGDVFQAHHSMRLFTVIDFMIGKN